MTPQDIPRTQFEQRMRLRRAATCVSGARVALEAGRVLEAQERLEEACRLDPEGLEARILLEQLKSIEPEDLFEPILPDEDQAAQGARRWSHWVAVLIAVVALAALAWWRAPAPDETRATPVRQPERTRPHVESPAVVDAQPAPGLDPAPASGAAPPSQQLEADPLPEGGGASSPSASNQRTLARAAQSRVDAGAAGGERPRGTTGQSPARAASGAASPADRRPAIPAPDRVVERAGPPAPSPAQPPAGVEPSRSLPPLAEALPTVGAAVPDERMARARPVEVPTPAPPPPAAAGDAAPASLRDRAADEEAIGEVLGQYADAYNRLDATAARRVWPTVDERALARAFAGLESQGVIFERCDLQVEGAEATAACRGRARYVPKVGSRDPISENRQWSFRLRRAGSGWQIVQAEAR